MKPTYLVAVAALALAVFFLVTPLAAQESRGSILGRITDASRAPVPGADVRATNIATGVTTSVISNDEGNELRERRNCPS